MGGLESLRWVRVGEVSVDVLDCLGHGVCDVVRLSVGAEEDRVGLSWVGEHWCRGRKGEGGDAVVVRVSGDRMGH
jgi:hypothetical protein